MNIALIGYGKMGKEIEKIAVQRGHTIVSIIDVNTQSNFDSPEFKNADLAIEFTTPETALNNYRKCFDNNISVVSGTTGWLEHLEEVKKICEKENQTFFYASNYSLGVNIFFMLNKYLAGIMKNFTDYDVKIEEIHHIYKKDAPSGTAISLAQDIIDENNKKLRWKLGDKENDTDLPVYSIREGEFPGIHEIIYQSFADIISIKHNALNRTGFALGAVVAAEFTLGKKGFLGMKDMLDFCK